MYVLKVTDELLRFWISFTFVGHTKLWSFTGSGKRIMEQHLFPFYSPLSALDDSMCFKRVFKMRKRYSQWSFIVLFIVYFIRNCNNKNSANYRIFWSLNLLLLSLLTLFSISLMTVVSHRNNCSSSLICILLFRLGYEWTSALNILISCMGLL